MNSGDGFRQGMGFGIRLGVEMLVSTGIGVAMGYALDHFFGTRPWFMVLGVFFGGAAGVLGVYRAATYEAPVEKFTEEQSKETGLEEEKSPESDDDLKF